MNRGSNVRVVAVLGLAVLGGVVGCELAVDFDRTKIDGGGIDASFGVDATTGDAIAAVDAADAGGDSSSSDGSVDAPADAPADAPDDAGDAGVDAGDAGAPEDAGDAEAGAGDLDADTGDAADASAG
jgi:hypothetical protein